MSYDYIAFIGRFAPFHSGHLTVLRRALEACHKSIVVIGSAKAARSTRQPWTAGEREIMIRAALGDDAERVIFCQVCDHLYAQNAWQVDVLQSVNDAIVSDGRRPFEVKIGLIRPQKSGSFLERSAFPQWDPIDVPFEVGFSSEEILDQVLCEGESDLNRLQSSVPAPVFHWLKHFRSTSACAALIDETNFIKAYKKAWSVAPYPPIFTTVDAVICMSGHVLLVRRGGLPGKGLWTLPGGFVEQDETLHEAAVREVMEETRISVPPSALSGSLRSQQVFDAPYRSQRGRTITYVFHFELESSDLASICAADDADLAKWTALSDLPSLKEKMFEDHAFILEHFLGTVF